MANIKITDMPELLPFDNYTSEGGTENNDYLPIIDSSETDVNLQNKKVAISTLFEKYLTTEDVRIEIASAAAVSTVEKITLVNNTTDINSNSGRYLFINPNGVDRSINIVLFSEGIVRNIKNTSSTNTIALNNMVTNNNTSVLNYTIQPTKSVQIIYDGIDHHVIGLD